MHQTHRQEPPPPAPRISAAAGELLSTRYCCGSEREALCSIEREQGAFTDDEREQVWSLVELWYQQDQRAAGVVAPVGATERERINRAFADDNAEDTPRFEGWGDSTYERDG